jgi:hypothetical protein
MRAGAKLSKQRVGAEVFRRMVSNPQTGSHATSALQPVKDTDSARLSICTDVAGALAFTGGYITIEQERDPRNAGGSLADLTASGDFLRRAGF